MSILSELAKEDVRDAAACDANAYNDYHYYKECVCFKLFYVANEV